MAWSVGSIPLDGSTGFTLARVDLGVGMVDQATVESVADWDSEDLAYGTWVAVKQDSTTVLYGSVTKVEPYARGGGAQGRRYTISCPWWHLERITYKQEFKYNSSGTVETKWRTKAWLGSIISAGEATRLTTLQVISEILSYASSEAGLGADGFAYSLSGFGVLAPVTEVVDQTCAALVTQCLRWHPNVVMYWRYTATSATLHLKPLSALPVKGLTVAAASASDPQPITAEVQPRNDLVPPVVVVKYERINTFDDPEDGQLAIMEMHEDVAGGTIEDQHAPGALVYTIELQGVKSTSIVQPIRTRLVPEETATALTGATNTTAVKWYQCHIGRFRLLDAAAIHVQSHLKAFDLDLTDPEDEPEDAPAPPPEGDPEDYPRELTEGTVQEWMTGVKATPMIARGKFKWQGSETAEADATMMALARKVFGSNLDQEVEFDVRYMATDATTRRYRTLAGFTAAEPWPEGLAAAIYEGLSTVRYEGTVTVRDDACVLSILPGDIINLVNQTGSGPVQRMTLQPNSGHTTWSFGWPGHLNPQDIYELQRASRANELTATYEPRRQDGARGTNQSQAVEGALRTPRSDVQQSSTPTVEETHAFKAVLKGGRVVGVYPGVVRTFPPSNLTLEVEVPANSTDGYWFWAKAERTGDFFNLPLAVTLEHGATLPDPPVSEGGLPPLWGFHPLFYVVTNATAVEFVGQVVKSPLWVKERPIESCSETTYELEWTFYGNESV